MNKGHHEMLLEITHPSGAEGWACPICGRRILLRVPPANGMLILEPGDPSASHSGSLGGLHIGGVQAEEGTQQPHQISEASLRPWIEALEKLDLDW